MLRSFQWGAVPATPYLPCLTRKASIARPRSACPASGEVEVDQWSHLLSGRSYYVYDGQEIQMLGASLSRVTA